MSSKETRTSQADEIEEILQDPRASRIDAVFLNQKPLQVIYYFEDKGTEGRIMINVDSLLPIFGGIRPTAAGFFETLDQLSIFVQANIRLNKCSKYKYADCLCHLIRDRVDPHFSGLEMFASSGCLRGHFHHACWSCVNLWLNDYLRVLILHQESKPLYVKATREICSKIYRLGDFDEYFNREHPEFYLRLAQRWVIPEHLVDGLIEYYL